MSVIHGWTGDYGTYPVPDRFSSVRVRRDGWPDQRFKLSKEMVAYFKRLDAERAQEAG